VIISGVQLLVLLLPMLVIASVAAVIIIERYVDYVDTSHAVV
jgi:hypothetical protein